MSQRRFAPARLRYLKARLSILARPGFLIAVAFLSVVGLVVKEYWTNPEFLQFSQNQELSLPELSSNSQSVLSDEDRAIAADIGNLSVLNYDQEQAKIPTLTNINDSKQVQKENEEKLAKTLDLAIKNQKANEIKPKIKLPTTNNSSTSLRNPFLKQAQNLLEFKLGAKEQVSAVNNLSPFSSGLQTPQPLFNLGMGTSNSTSQNRNATPESALKAAINLSNSQNQETPATTTSTNNLNSSFLSKNQRLRSNQINPLVDTTIFNQPLNNQIPASNYNQSGLNNQLQNPYSNFNNNQVPANNYNQSGLNNQLQNPYSNFNNNQVPANNYNHPGLNNQLQNPYGNFNNNQVPTPSYAQPNLGNNFNNNQQQNIYSNFNNNQLPTNNYNQQNLNNRRQNPYSNFNNTRINTNRYSPQIQRRIQNIYDRLNNRNNPNVVTPNNYTAPNNTNTGFGQPNVQQLNSPYSTQNPVQYPTNGYGY